MLPNVVQCTAGASGDAGRRGLVVVTGVRRDPWANTNRVAIEEAKPIEEQGTFMHPEAWGQPREKGAAWRCLLRTTIDGTPAAADTNLP